MKRPKIIARIFGLFKKAEVEEDLVKEIRELAEFVEERIENPEPKKEEPRNEEPKDKIHLPKSEFCL